MCLSWSWDLIICIIWCFRSQRAQPLPRLHISEHIMSYLRFRCLCIMSHCKSPMSTHPNTATLQCTASWFRFAGPRQVVCCLNSNECWPRSCCNHLKLKTEKYRMASLWGLFLVSCCHISYHVYLSIYWIQRYILCIQNLKKNSSLHEHSYLSTFKCLQNSENSGTL